MVFITKIFTVILTSCIYFWAGIPTGLALKFSLLTSAILTATGAFFEVLVITILSRPLQLWLLKKFEKSFAKFEKTKLKRLWDKFGASGFCLLSPILTGAWQAALIAIFLGTDIKKIVFWTFAGVILFTALAFIILYFGIENIPFFKRLFITL